MSRRAQPGGLLDCVERARRRAERRGRPVVAAHAEPVSEYPDPLDLFAGAEGSGERRFFAARPDASFELLGLGCAAQVRRSSLARARREIDVERRAAVLGGAPGWPGSLPLWVGGAAFEARPRSAREPLWRDFSSAGFAVPELSLARVGGRRWLVRALSVAPSDGAWDALDRARERWASLFEKPGPDPSRLRRAPERAPSPSRAYRAGIAAALAAIRSGEPDKVVLAHADTRTLEHRLRAADPLRALVAAHPESLVFAQGVGRSTFLGASPERLIRLDGTSAEAWAVAGTAQRTDSPAGRRRLARELVDSAKERAEHDFVVRAVEEALSGPCAELDVPAQPEVLEAGPVQHLRTRIRGRLARASHVLDLVARLHPTPALGGTPRSSALELIRALESCDRGWYAGPIGWIDAAGGGDFWVALRCGLIAGRTLRLYAGSGLVAASDPDREAEETALKLRVLWRALETS